MNSLRTTSSVAILFGAVLIALGTLIDGCVIGELPEITRTIFAKMGMGDEHSLVMLMVTP